MSTRKRLLKSIFRKDLLQDFERVAEAATTYDYFGRHAFLHFIRHSVVQDIYNPDTTVPQITLPNTKTELESYVRLVFRALTETESSIDWWKVRRGTKSDVLRWYRYFRAHVLPALGIRVNTLNKIHSDILTRLTQQYITNIETHLICGYSSYLARYLVKYASLSKKHAEATALYILRNVTWWGKSKASSMLSKPYVCILPFSFQSLLHIQF